ncbi:hypothetical protein AVEN_234394-1 [Araneus ventricosus]|uniref:Uncharacterized protein n=1 Tax=Araneus ventricosus TaxID=182803 RepID=A0A4Y2A8F0_ARAVE|nr:hypothetical protein AVEN_234394-1 [Araneus ventricosus]
MESKVGMEEEEDAKAFILPAPDNLEPPRSMGGQGRDVTGNEPGLVMSKDFIDGLSTNMFRFKDNRWELTELPIAAAYPSWILATHENEIDDAWKMIDYFPVEFKVSYNIINWPTNTSSVLDHEDQD